ncbi:unnamed protein product [Euphydryas editha]|uniref:Uncharacterized protein n=1 Tax=Euphydryas editha TaxID=104508 RepID=A0AAU9V5Y8_EUPED|nr:unnamed protein product [Euphydryas editha]
MKKIIINTYLYLEILGCYSTIFSIQVRARPTIIENTREISLVPMTMTTLHAPVSINMMGKVDHIRKKRQLPRLLPLRSRLRPPKLPLLPPRRPIILPMITSAVSDGIRTYPYYLQEIPLAFGETIIDSVREAAPHITGALKDISPGFMEIINTIPATEKDNPIHNIMRKIPTAIHDTIQIAIDPVQEEYEEPEQIQEIQRLTEEPTKQKNLYARQMKPLKTLQETYLNTKEKLNSKFEETKQKAQYFYRNLLQDYENITPRRKTHRFESPSLMKKTTQTITPVINESLLEMAQIPRKIKQMVEQIKQ